MARLRINFKNQRDELSYYKGLVFIGELLAQRANKMNEILELDKLIVQHVANIKPYKTWDEIGAILNMSGTQAKKYFSDLMPETTVAVMEEK